MEDSINGYKSSKEEIKSPKKSSNETKAEKKDEASSSHSEVDRKHVHNGVSGSKRKFEEPQRTRERGGSGSGSPKKHKLSAITNSSKTDVSVKSPPAKAPENVELFKLWVDKYKPTSLKQIIGQQGEKSNVNKLVRWLRDWYKNHDGTKKLTKPSPWAKDDSGAYFKAALLSGPPGVGKTTTAYLVCKELGMDIVEFNASDTRSKKLLSQEVSELLSSKSLSPFLQGGGVTKDHVLVMDEVDGMAGTEDRGGVQELIQLIKTSKVPIICMCNDRNHPKIRSLANYCFDLRFYKPRVEQIKGAMLSICFKEKLKVKPDTLVDIITSTNQDIRLTLNHLSMLAARGEKDLAAASKHVKLGPWDVLKKVFSAEDHKHMSIYDKSDLFFHDYSVAPLFVHENYLIVVPHSKEASSKRTKMELFAKAATSLCNGDLIESAIRSNNAWSLLPAQAIFSSLVPGEVLEGHVGGQINFPAWFGKNSRRNKLDRFTQELQTHSRLRISGSKSALNLDYAKPLRDHILRPLIQEGSDGVQTALATLHDYNLLREDLDSLAELNTWPGSKDPSAAIDSKVFNTFVIYL
ncbi:hypothetical protein AAG570_002171 [Ranatra chinensis]|uniref:Activator 1 large subunit n=1 Tax=Ranatra chinensis TaxID=642074 RepID=A0ABD0YTG2_9HEMI